MDIMYGRPEGDGDDELTLQQALGRRSDHAEGDFAYFVDLDLKTVTRTGPHPHREKVWVYRVEGKAHPMLVVSIDRNREPGRSWYIVLPVTTKGLDRRGNVKPKMFRIGGCVDEDKESFLRLERYRYPENMLDCDSEHSPVSKQCDPEAYGHILKIVSHMKLGMKIGSPLGIEP